jgi:epoxyqueuosine reductase
VSDAYTAELLRLVREAGADRVGVTDAEPLVRARAAIEMRTSAGYTDEMQFTFRNPERSTTPTMAVAGARSILVAARSYFADDVGSTGDVASTGGGVPARVARYAWRDHYAPLRQALQCAAARLKNDGHRAVVFADDNSIVDREVAYRAGLGWYGKNANLLLEGLGSWFVLGCVVTTAELQHTSQRVADACGSCSRCIEACPTGAIVEPGVIDARKCLAWLLQKPGTFDPQYRAALGTRIYGCDECQEVCPPTRRGAIDRTLGDERATVDVLELLTAPDDDVMKIVGRWYVADRNPRWIRRNALIVLGNSRERIIGDAADNDTSLDDVVSVLTRYIHGDDALLREHAEWAARRLGIAHMVADERIP